MMGGLDLSYLARVVSRRFMYFLVPFLVVLVGGGTLAYVLPRLFNSSAILLIQSQQISDNFVKSTITEVANQRLELLKQRVTSRENLLALIDKFGLYAERKDLSRSEKVDLMRERVNFTFIDTGLDTAVVTGKAGELRKVSGPKNNVALAFAVGFDSESPNIAAQVANALVTLVLEEDVRNRSSTANQTTKFLAKEFDRAATELSKVDNEIADYKDKNAAMLPERLQFSMAQLDRQNREIEDIKRQIAGAPDQKRLIEIEAKIKEANAFQGADGKPAPGTLEQQLTKLQQVQAQLATVYSETHPEMRSLRAQIASLKKQIEAQAAIPQTNETSKVDVAAMNAGDALLAQKLQAIDQAVIQAQKRVDDLTKSNDELQKNIQGTAIVAANIDSLQRKRAAMQGSFDDIQVKLGQAKLGEQLEENQQSERFSVVESPVVPTEAKTSKRFTVALGSVVAAFASGGGTAFAAEFLDNTIWRAGDLAQKLPRTNILVNIPYIMTHGELRRHRRRLLGRLILIILIGAVCALLIHFFVTPLDLLYYTVLRRLR